MPPMTAAGRQRSLQLMTIAAGFLLLFLLPQFRPADTTTLQQIVVSAQVFGPLRSALITLQQPGGLARAGRAARNGIAAVVH